MHNSFFYSLFHLCDYEVRIDTERGAEAIYYLYSMAQLNIMEEFRTHRMIERKHATYFVIRHDMEREQDKEKR
jgi:hypothetical protein